MARITDHEAALRLARALHSDVRLYNEATIAAGGDLGPAVDEARELFRSRVSPELNLLFEEQGVALGLLVAPAGVADVYAPIATGASVSAIAASTKSAKTSSSDRTDRTDRTDPTNVRVIVAILVLLSILVTLALTTFARG